MVISFPPTTMSKTPQALQNMPLTSNSLFSVTAIFDNSRWSPSMRSNMATKVPCHLNLNFKFSEFSEFSDVWPPPPYTWIMVYGNSRVCALSPPTAKKSDQKTVCQSHRWLWRATNYGSMVMWNAWHHCCLQLQILLQILKQICSKIMYTSPVNNALFNSAFLGALWC